MSQNPFESEKSFRDERPLRSSTRAWIAVTLFVNVITYVAFGMTICGCHFQWLAVPAIAPVALWTIYTLVAWRTVGECYVAFANLLLALGWLCFEWEANLCFLL
jgi:hypothetical protein